MTKETALNTFKEIMSKSGMGEVISLSENVNELADIMIYQEHGAPEYLALNGTPLFTVEEIRNILYQYGKEKFYNYGESEIQFVIELMGDARYVLEFGNNGLCGTMFFNDEWTKNDEEIKACLAQYNQKVSKKLNIEWLVDSVARIIEEHGIIDDSELKEIRDEVNRYMKGNPADKDFLLSYAYSSLQMFVYEDTDLFDMKNIVRMVIREKCEDDFVDYIRKSGNYSADCLECGYYLSLVAAALQFIQDVKGERTVG